MKTLKRLFALILILVLIVACFAGCHEKGEIAVTAGGVEFTSGYYACALVYADTQARSIVENSISVNGTIPSDIVYWDFKVEGTDYVKWVEDTTIDTLKQIATVRNVCEQKGITLSDEILADAKLQAETQWEQIGVYMEKNGVAKETFIQYIEDIYLTDEYFKNLYGEGGEKAISADDVNKQFTEHYVLVNGITSDFYYLSETEKEEIREQFTAFETALKDGSKTFEQVYLEANDLDAEEHTHETSEDGENLPQDLHASILSDTNSNYTSDQFDTAKELEVGQVKLVTLPDDAGLVLMVKKDITADPYYLENLDTTIRKELKYDEFLKDLAATASKLDCEISDFSTGQFDVKKIKYS